MLSALKNGPFDDNGWNWICGKLADFKVRRLKRKWYGELCWNAITRFPDHYHNDFDDFIKIINSISYVTETCERFMNCSNLEDAYRIASPCTGYLRKNISMYSQGQLCFTLPEEAILFAAEQGDNCEIRAEEDYTGFFLCYARILNTLLEVSDVDFNKRKQDRDFCLEHAVKLSPYNASVWETQAAVYRYVDCEKYFECIEKALKYSVASGTPDGLLY